MPPSYWNSTVWPSARSSAIDDVQAAGEERGVAHPLLERREVEHRRLEDVGVGQEGDRRAGLLGRLAALEGAERGAALIGLAPDVAVAADLDVEPLREGVDDRDADAVQAAGDLVAAALAELAAGVQDGEHDLDRRLLLLLHRRHRDAAAVVGHGDASCPDGSSTAHVVAVAGQRLVDRVVDHLVDEVVQPAGTGRADVHARPAPDRLQALEDGDVLRVVATRLLSVPRGTLTCGQRSSDTSRSPGERRARRGRGIEKLWS